MRISWGNQINLRRIDQSNGFGYATDRIVTTLRQQGHLVSSNLDNADVELWFDQPQWIKWHNPDAVKIAYVPWESTWLMPGWRHKMNSADEVWTPSPKVAEWFVSDGINVPVDVYQHGVDKVWEPVKRVLDGDFKVFHHGGEAARKGWDDTARMFMEHFPTDAQMNFKMTKLKGWNVPIPRVNFIEGKLALSHLVKLYQRQHLLVYPSWGEGFGLAPLQAMATGMPVLITKGWAPYEHLVPRECLIDSELVDSKWNYLHPGKMWKPDYDDMCRKALAIRENYDYFADKFYELAPIVKAEYDWSNLTEAAFKSLQTRWKI